MVERFFWYRPNWVVPDIELLNGCVCVCVCVCVIVPPIDGTGSIMFSSCPFICACVCLHVLPQAEAFFTDLPLTVAYIFRLSW